MNETESKVPDGPSHVLARDDLREFHHQFEREPWSADAQHRHGRAWSDSLAFTHCICFGAAARAAAPLVAICQRMRAGWLPHRLSEGSWWWGRPSGGDGFHLWSTGAVPTMSIVERMTDGEVQVWVATLHPAAPEHPNLTWPEPLDHL